MSEQDEAMKAAVKEAIREFLEDKWTRATSAVGKWFLGALAAAIVSALAYLILWANGWRLPQ